MPPKAKANAPSKKNVEKKKAGVLEDKTFGLKNKKGAKQQKFIAVVTHQVKHGDQATAKRDQENKEKDKANEKKLAMQAELNLLFKPTDQKAPKGVDPKSILCNLHKTGQCTKGTKCKFSHDLTIERKAEKRNVFETEEDTMDTWDETKLAEVIAKKHGESNKQKMQTAIICKFFVEAVENNKYGWFWSCPTGVNCHYKHVLPPGFKLKKDQKKDTSKVDQISLEELIETERASLSSNNLTKIDINSFLAWKERKRKEKIAKRKKDTDKKKNAFKDGQTTGISGREMFEFNPDMIRGAGDDEEGDDFVFEREKDEDEEEEKVVGWTPEALAASATTEKAAGGTERQPAEKAQAQAEASKLDEAVGASADPKVETDAAIAAAMSAVNGQDIAEDDEFDENLFDGEDLDLIEDELEDLDI